jgi:hypothetical protein
MSHQVSIRPEHIKGSTVTLETLEFSGQISLANTQLRFTIPHLLGLTHCVVRV